ncbi:MAG: hypothetical protein COB66_06705 [Coxiella sp. (in: Bacteria)]|nr:MAG: hypothetical protein COB66_06705 [Coxiella sp. (in: g-proteobacteria)]
MWTTSLNQYGRTMNSSSLPALNIHLPRKKQVSFKDLERYKWVLREGGSGTGELVTNYITNKCTITTELTLSNPDAIKNYIRNNLCLTCVSNNIYSPKTDNDIATINVTGFKLVRPFYLLSNTDKYQTNAAQALYQLLQDS